jgi:hypothetical protein
MQEENGMAGEIEDQPKLLDSLADEVASAVVEYRRRTDALRHFWETVRCRIRQTDKEARKFDGFHRDNLNS